jgi:hypothetical protein
MAEPIPTETELLRGAESLSKPIDENVFETALKESVRGD